MSTAAVCVCTCNRPELLAKLLGRLAGMEPGEAGFAATHLVVVDNRPGGTAREVCEAWRARLPTALTFVEEPQRGISFARNRAVETALALGADEVAFIDDDDEPLPDWLAQLTAERRRTGADMVFGTWRHPEALDLPRLLRDVRFFRPMRLDNHNSYGLPAWAGTYNVLLSRRLLERMKEAGPVFDPSFALTGGGDTDLFIRAHRAGFAHAAATLSAVYRIWEPERMTLRGVMRRAFRIGCTRMQLAAAHHGAVKCRKISRRSAMKLARTLARLPTRLTRPASCGVLLVRAAQYAGEIYAGSGRRFVYYGERRPLGSAQPQR